MMDTRKSVSPEQNNSGNSSMEDQEIRQQSISPTPSSHLDPPHVVATRDPSPVEPPTAPKLARHYDLVIFGASGSVGKFLVEEMALVVDKYYTSQQQQQTSLSTDASDSGVRRLRDPAQFAQNTIIRRPSVPRTMDDIRWAVAGRSAMRISEALCQAELSTGIKNLSNRVPVLLADLNHHRSLLDMCSKASLIVNCAGPYTTDGEALIKACIQSGTSYIDLAHETTFIERIRQVYEKQARKAGVYIINGCGFQSMSSEMGLNFCKQVVDGQIEEVKIVLSLSDSKAIVGSPGSRFRGRQRGIISQGMWNSLLIERAQEISMADRFGQSTPPINNSTTITEVTEEDESERLLPQITEGSQQKPTLVRKDTQSLVRDVVEFRNRKSLAWLQLIKGFDETGRGYCLPVNGITSEEAQLIRGEMANYEHKRPDLDSAQGWRPIRCTSFLSMRDFYELVIILIWLMIFNIFVKFSPLRSLMRSFPTLSSLGYVCSRKLELGRDNLSHIKFCQTFIAYGTPGDHSGDPLEQRDKNLKRKQEQLLVTRVVGPEPNHMATATFAIQAALTFISEQEHLPLGGGVLTPGAAFSETNIIYQLRRRNIKFEVMKKA